MAEYNSDRTGANIDATLDKVDTLDAKIQPTGTGVNIIGESTSDSVVTDQATLTAIAQTKAETAVDVFVYDTRKDSDGGAWRKRTQGTSWYNEPLNTSTRGSRKEFPAVAVIVAEANKVTIYDGDDPSMPMWMVFNRLAGIKDMLGRRDSVSVQSINGLLCVVASDTSLTGGYAPLIKINFISDVVKHTNNVGTYTFKETISERETAVYSSASPGDTDYWIVSEGSLVSATLNDVAMTVLPNAPIDPDTGLPVPTIAVATGGGVSVIKDDGTVVDITFSVDTYEYVDSIEFTEDNRIIFFTDNASNYRFVKVYEIPSVDIAESVYNTKGSAEEFYVGNSNGLYSGADMSFSLTSGGEAKFARRNIGTPICLVKIHENSSDPTKGLLAQVSSTYNTGWMNGDIKLATLSDTDDTDLVGSELVTNGTFDTDLSGWTGDSDGSIVSWNNSGAIDIDRNNSDFLAGKFTAQYSVNGLEIGKDYTISADVLALSNYVSLSIANDNYSVIAESQEINTTGAINLTFKATTTSAIIGLGARLSLTATASLDNVSVRLAEPDRSVNGNGLQVFGTVQKSPVATGADLVAYSGFSSSNYLQQPMGVTDLNSTSFSITCWFKCSGTSQWLIGTGNAGNTSKARAIYIPSSGELVATNWNNAVSSGVIVTDDVWRQATAIWENISGTSYSVSIYINGELKATGTTSLPVFEDTSIYVGHNANLHFMHAAQNSSVSLARISSTIPTAEQIAKIYRDEKPLFQEGAQATLHGTSDAVTALAYDDTTELLHVGTSSGRSVFQGLQRVDNTTDAVGTAISASNNLVVEE